MRQNQTRAILTWVGSTLASTPKSFPSVRSHLQPAIRFSGPVSPRLSYIFFPNPQLSPSTRSTSVAPHACLYGSSPTAGLFPFALSSANAAAP